MKEYFSHDYRARADRKLVNIMARHGVKGIGIYWCIVEMLYEEGGSMPIECERIAYELRTKCDIVKSIINDFELFEIKDNFILSKSVLERLEIRNKKSKCARESAYIRWNKCERNANAMRTQCDSNAIKEKKRKENNIKIKNKYTEDFISFWTAYPKKVGKDDAFKSWKKKEKPSLSEILAKIDIQKKSEQWQKDSGQFIPNPATYINQGRWYDEIKIISNRPEFTM